MLSNRNLKFLYFSLLVISCVFAEEGEKDKKEELKDATVNVNATSGDNVKYVDAGSGNWNLTAAEGYRLKTLKAGDKTLYTVDTSKYSPKTAAVLTHGEDKFFRLDLLSAKPLLFKRKSDTEWSEYKYGDYLDNVVFKGKDSKELDVSKFADTALFDSTTFGSGKEYSFKNTFKVSKVKYDKDEVHDPSKAKYTAVKVYVGAEDKKVVRLDFFYTGDDRFKETYFNLVDGKWKKMEQTEANKFLNALNSSWALDYKPSVDRFSPLAVLSSVAIVTFALFYYL